MVGSFILSYPNGWLIDSQQLALEIDDEDIYGDDGTLSFEKSFQRAIWIIILSYASLCITA